MPSGATPPPRQLLSLGDIERVTHGGGRSLNDVDSSGEDSDGTKHEEKLRDGGEGLDLVHVRSPHRLQVIVLWQLVTASFVSSRRGGEEGGRDELLLRR